MTTHPKVRRLFSHPVMALAHGAFAAAAYALAYLLRFDLPLPSEELDRLLRTLPLLVAIRMITYALLGLYGGVWRYVSMRDLLAIVSSTTLGTLLFAAVVYALQLGVPRSIFLIDLIASTGLLSGSRLGIRALREASSGHNGNDRKIHHRKVVLVGAGDAGELLLRELRRNQSLPYHVAGIVDDDPRMLGRRLHGVEVVGSVDDLPEVCLDLSADEVLIAIPSATEEQRHRIAVRGRQSSVPLKTVPAMGDLLAGRAHIGHLREVLPKDLLGRSEVRVEPDRLLAAFCGRTILITGAGGSIGSELCRQLALLEPRRLVLYEQAESSLYFLEQELRGRFPDISTVPVVGDVCDPRKVDEVFEASRPDIIFHAAAYKHVPLMERQPLAAIQNNVFGTEMVFRAGRLSSAERFVLISTDKAVGPVGVMGMTKRLAEEVLLADTGGPTMCASVRFGNVLGSVGSVLPLFQLQIARGGPVTVTDPDASRYFMLISEAAQLVLQAGAIGRGGEVFFLDMGDPVRIGDFAEDVIRLSGLHPGEMPVEVVGLRPGERMSEELVMQHEIVEPSEHERIWKVRTNDFDREAFGQNLETLRGFVNGRDEDRAVAQLRAMTADHRVG